MIVVIYAVYFKSSDSLWYAQWAVGLTRKCAQHVSGSEFKHVLIRRTCSEQQ